MKIASVSDVTQYIKALIDSAPELQDLWVEGEVSNYKPAASGHCYFTLKDAESEIKCVMWRGSASRLAFSPQQGDWVQAHGYVSVYQRSGAYQFYVDTLSLGGIGARWQQFEELKERLEAEGLFDPDRKRPLPAWPHRIGLVTSPTGAARRDIENVLSARYPLAEVVLSPSLVQGAQAPEALLRALEQLNKIDDIDVIIVARGGGSLEDLWAFNDERVARAIAASRVPVISGVGHETDFTIADFCADLRAPTPSAAAAAAAPDLQEIRSRLYSLTDRILVNTEKTLDTFAEQLTGAKRVLQLYDPSRKIAELMQRLDDLVRRGARAMASEVGVARSDLVGSVSHLEALNPSLVLKRGYAVVQDSATHIAIDSVFGVRCGAQVEVLLHDGTLAATIDSVPE